jgi:mRNA interferase RelE/StbE
LYSVSFLKPAIKDLSKIDKLTAKRLVDHIQWLSVNLETTKLFPLKGDLSGLFKLRDGSYRIIYEINRKEKSIIVHFVGHRKDIYKQK